ncbi:MAG: CDP-alcohol phosphatidyltransferase family protein [Nanoarchaeota archaeon]
MKEAKKGSKGYGGSFGAVYVFSPIARKIATLLLRTSFSPNQVTIAGFLIGMIGVVMLFSKNPIILFIAGLFLFLQHVFDCVDGLLARLTDKKSKVGALLDEFLDRIFDTSLYLAATFIAFRETGLWYVWPIGFLAGMGSMRTISVYLKLEFLQYKGKPIRTLPFYRQIFNYGNEVNTMLIFFGILFGLIYWVLLGIAVAANLFATARFFYAVPKLKSDSP